MHANVRTFSVCLNLHHLIRCFSSEKKELHEKIELITSELQVLQKENKNLHDQATKLHEKHHSTTLQVG